VVTEALGKGQARAGDAVRVSEEPRTLPPRPATSVARTPPPCPTHHPSHPRHLRQPWRLPPPRQFLRPLYLWKLRLIWHADRGGPRRSGGTGAGLHRKAPDRC